MRELEIIFSVLGVGLVLVIYGTIRKNRWGINLEPVNCPRCQRPYHRFASQDHSGRLYGEAARVKIADAGRTSGAVKSHL